MCRGPPSYNYYGLTRPPHQILVGAALNLIGPEAHLVDPGRLFFSVGGLWGSEVASSLGEKSFHSC